MTAQPAIKAVTIHILPNISRRKGNLIIELGQLIGNNKLNIFLQRSCRK